MQKEYQLAVDIEKKILTPSFEVNTLDLKTIKLKITITKGMTLVDLTDITVRMSIRKPDGNVIFQDCQVVNAKGGQVEIILENQAYILPGSYSAEIMCFKGSDKVAVTGSFSYRSIRGIMDDKAIESKSEFTAITGMIGNVESIVDDLKKNGTGIDAQARQEVQQVTAKLADATEQIGFASQYGFVADYVGTPQYDGQDGTRVTATDNTAAFVSMLDDCIAKKNLTVYFPRGHYGIKTGNITKDLTGCTLTIYGDGFDSSIIDFIKEDNTKTSYVDESKANYIAKITNAKQVIIKDIHIKATTNRNNVNGNQSSTDAVYYGSVWGLVFDTFEHLRLERVKVSHFNYRGISTTKATVNSNANCNPLVEIIDCVGTENKGSGFWLRRIQLVKIKGGEFSYNGQKGTTGTGYGITCQEYVGKVIVDGGYYHHNYRKGFDTHGCLNVTLNNVIFEDNVLYNFAILGWAVYPSENIININNVSMLRVDKTWLKSCYAAINTNGITTAARGILFAINDQSQSGVYQNKLKKVFINNLNLKGGYCGDEETPNGTSIGIVILAPSAEVVIENTDINLNDWKVNSNSVYSACPIQIDPLELYLNKTTIKWLEDSSWGADKGSLFIWKGMANRKFHFKDTKFELNNCYVMAGTGTGGTLADPGDSNTTMRIYENLLVSWLSLPSETNSRKYFGESIDLYPKLVNNLKTVVNNTDYSVSCRPFFNDTKGLRVYNSSHVLAANVDLCDIVLDRTISKYVAEIDAYDDYIKIVNDVVKVDGTNITLKERTTFTDTDGRTKTKITLKSKAAFPPGDYYIRVRITGNQNSWGIEKIVKIAN